MDKKIHKYIYNLLTLVLNTICVLNNFIVWTLDYSPKSLLNALVNFFVVHATFYGAAWENMTATKYKMREQWNERLFLGHNYKNKVSGENICSLAERKLLKK